MEQNTQFIGQSFAFLDAVEQAERAAELNRPVLVIGERGTGKELIAERLHRLSPRWGEVLITMNCAALPETLIEAELFGHEAGAFTGATRVRAGRFEEAHGGTLFLDELGTLSMAAQERLLRVVEYGEVTRIGASRPVQVDVRIVAATNEDLPLAAEEGRFRADLLDRLSFEVITLPPLRAREGDVRVLTDHFGRRMAAEIGWPQWPGFGAAAMAELEAYRWPGNVRELRNVIERAVYRWDEPARPIDRIVFDPFGSPWRPVPMPKATVNQTHVSRTENSHQRPVAPAVAAYEDVADLKAAMDAHEVAILRGALSRYRFNQRATAKGLSLSYDQLRHCLKKHGLLAATAESET
ncbi:phage shock protein operon transcriptional activator [Sphingobium sp. SCG-1]|uniref:phage shock protein operon transcriptional activator n=1 Tax=Sphingobium sp. SCG-1 TaxID=2072936 RepID=UPI000CD681C6|nr:phage shock protein operon transcriptional activator [Sphingobium sp. SCG-1]AUW59094.1 phage shock protein operon transcriptional activator [Sphingobium sp. SCG-1]